MAGISNYTRKKFYLHFMAEVKDDEIDILK